MKNVQKLFHGESTPPSHSDIFTEIASIEAVIFRVDGRSLQSGNLPPPGPVEPLVVLDEDTGETDRSGGRREVRREESREDDLRYEDWELGVLTGDGEDGRMDLQMGEGENRRVDLQGEAEDRRVDLQRGDGMNRRVEETRGDRRGNGNGEESEFELFERAEERQSDVFRGTGVGEKQGCKEGKEEGSTMR